MLHSEFLRAPLAHRALHDLDDGRPENSRAAVRAAIAAGYGIEIDVQCSADGVAMVFHDYGLKRLAESIEPILIVAMGILVLILALGVFLPIWDLGAAAMGRG